MLKRAISVISNAWFLRRINVAIQNSSDNRLVLGLPKGSLQEATFRMFEKAGFRIRSSSRSYFPSIDDPEIEVILLRAQEIPVYVQEGVLDVGITGYDWIQETDSDVEEIAELVYAKQGLRPVRWVLAAPKVSGITGPKDLEGKTIATEAVNLSKAYLKKNGVNGKVQYSWGATEAKTARVVDAIIEITETGSSLKAHSLDIIDTVLASTTRVIANKELWHQTDENSKSYWKKDKAKQLLMLLKGVVVAETKSGLMMNVPSDKLDGVTAVLKERAFTLQDPTITNLSDSGWCAINTIIDKKKIREAIPELKAAGAKGIVEYPLNKVIPDEE
jgi:ATP phosphoribosyltransferase